MDVLNITDDVVSYIGNNKNYYKRSLFLFNIDIYYFVEFICIAVVVDLLNSGFDMRSLFILVASGIER